MNNPPNRWTNSEFKAGNRGFTSFSNFARNFGKAANIFRDFPEASFRSSTQPGIHGECRPITIWSPNPISKTPKGIVNPGGVKGSAVGKGSTTSKNPKLR